MADLATLKISVDASGAIRVVDQFGKATESAAKKSDGLTGSLKSAALGFATLGTAAAILQKVVEETSEASKVQAQLGAVLRSTGGVAGQTVDSLNDHSAALQRMTAYSDDAIGAAQAMLLTFAKIRGDVFPQATQAVLDLATVMGGDLQGAAIQIGKALNDPILGVTALSKAGVQFSPVQKEMIKGFVETNQMAKAQGVILAELKGQTDGSAAAYRKTLGGALDALKISFSDLFEIEGTGLNSMVERINLVADALSLLPLRMKLVAENMKNVRLQFDSFFDLGGSNAALDAAARAEAKANGRPAPPPMLTPAQQLNQSNAELARLDRQLRELQASVLAGQLARRVAGEGRGLTPSGSADGPTDAVVKIRELRNQIAQLNPAFAGLTGDAEQLTAILNVLRASVADGAAALETRAMRLDEERKQALAILPMLEGENRERKNAVQLVTSLGDATNRLAESTRVFLEQTQIAVGRFFSDFLKDGFSSIGRFWDDFKQVGRDALGNLFAKEFMDRIGTRLGEKLSGAVGGALGKLGGLGAGVLGPLAAIGGITAGVLSMFGKTSKWEEAADAQNKAARAQLAAAESLRQTVTQQRAAFLDDFLNYSNTETDQQREMRSLANRRDQLGRDAYGIAMTATGGTGLSNQLKQLLDSGNFSQTVIDLIRRDAGSFNLSDFARKNLLDFADSLEDLNAAFARNTQAAQKAAKAQGLLSLTQFRDSLNLSAQSPLSPTAQLAEARRQYDVILALAKGGDQSAISSLPETARTLLDASRAVNASGVRYAQDFAKVTSDTTALIEAIRQEPIDIADGILDRTEPWFADALATADASLVVQQAGFQSVVDELVAVRSEISNMKKALVIALDEVAAAV